MRIVLLIALLLCTAASAADKAYQAPSPEPTAEETLTLEFINRFRANPAVEGLKVLPADGKPIPLCPGFDIKLFKEEMQALQAAPPLVFNLALLDGARKHAHYMIVNGQGHGQEEGKPGFTGKMPWDRAAAAGYTGDGIGENVARDLLNPWHTMQGFVVDWKMGAPGGMHPERGHRKILLNKDDREVGIGLIAHKSGLSCVQNFGNRAALPRLAGGVVFVDLNGNRFYDIGEGVEGATISAGEASTATWSSGAYTLELPNAGEVTLTATIGKHSESKKFAAGSENIKFDFALDPKAVDADCVAQMEGIQKANEKSEKRKKSLELLISTEGVPLSAEIRKRKEALIKSTDTELTASRAALFLLLRAYSPEKFNPTVTEIKTKFAGTAAEAWFDKIQVVGELAGELQKLESAAKAGQADQATIAALRQRLEKLAPTTTGQLKIEIYKLLARLKALDAKK